MSLGEYLLQEGGMGERKQVEGSLFFSQKEIPLRSNVATAPNVIPEPTLELLLRRVSYQRR